MVKLGDLCSIQLGGTPARKISRYWDPQMASGNVWLSIADMPKTVGQELFDSKEYLSDDGAEIVKLVKKGTLLFSFKLSIGRTCFAGKDLRTNEAIAALSILDERVIEKQYLAKFLAAQDWDVIAAHDEKLKGKTLNKAKLKELHVTVPPLAEQKRIVAILDQAFEGIDRAVTHAEKNVANARELFESHLNAIFTQRGEEWGVKRLSEVCENLDSKRVPITKSKRKTGDVPYYGASGKVDHVADYIFDEDLLLVSEDGANLLARTYPIAFSITGKSWVNNHAHVLRFEKMSSQKFIEYYLNLISLKPYVSGMAQPKLNQKALNSITLPFPSQEEQVKAVDNFDRVRDETRRLDAIYKKKLTALTELKQSITQKAFAGELTAELDQDLEVAVA